MSMLATVVFPLVLSATVDGQQVAEADTALEALADLEAAPAPEAGPSGPAPLPKKFNQWSIGIAPGVAVWAVGQYSAVGPNFRLNPWVHAWRGGFLIGGGPGLHYTLLIDKDADDKVHLFTVNGDMVVGGGVPQKFAVYAHLTMGAGVLSASDGQTNTKIMTLGARAGVGVGLHGYITPRFSLGALVDFTWPGLIDALVTANIHFGVKPKGG